MTPAQILLMIQLAQAAITLAKQAMELYPELRAAMGTEDQAALDAEYQKLTDSAHATIATLKAIPDDPV